MRRFLLVALLSSPLFAQLSGTYVVTPAGGPGVFTTVAAALNATLINGISGPVEFLIVAGNYQESVSVLPIPGMSARRTVTLRALTGGTVHLTGAGNDSFILLGVPFLPLEGLVFDGLDFDGAPGYAISSTSLVHDIEVRNCRFAPAFSNHATMAPIAQIAVFFPFAPFGPPQQLAGWHIHHNRFRVQPGFQSVALHVQRGRGWDIHHNLFELNACSGAIHLNDDSDGFDAIHDNLFTGTLLDAAATINPPDTWPVFPAVIRSDYVNFNNDIAHNTFLISIPNFGACVAASNYGGQFVRVHGNVFFLARNGTCIEHFDFGTARQLQRLGNLFFTPLGGSVGRLRVTGNPQTVTSFATLAAWQAATGQDAASISADPLFANATTAPFDLHPAWNSPVRNAAAGTPAYVVTDFDGRLRDALPDIGAYESTSFATFGSGCPGTASLVPVLSGSGPVQFGSPTFTVALANAPGGSFALLAVGLSRTAAGAIALPYPLGGGCALLVSPDAVHALAVAGGSAAQPMPIPANTALVGTNLYCQWLVADPGAPSVFGVSVTNAGALQL